MSLTEMHPTQLFRAGTFLTQSTPDDPDTKPKTPRDYDKNVGDRVEKKPRNPESPQQTHENEDYG
jgi:hypothetical protein